MALYSRFNSYIYLFILITSVSGKGKLALEFMNQVSSLSLTIPWL